ncbi:MAG: hypothetical protein AAF570_27090, partial [Bacteroidota bacterium]
MYIESIETEPVFGIPYRYVGSGGRDVYGRVKVMETVLPVLRGTVSGLPEGLDGLVCTADLQGRWDGGGRNLLLGMVVPERLADALPGQFGMDPKRTGAILAGDLFATLESRGGGGDVIPVWNEFRFEFAWVAGVAGNHDLFGSGEEDLERYGKTEGVHLLGSRSAEVEGLKLAGIHGIMGRKRKNFRTPPEVYLAALARLAKGKPDMVVLHSGPGIYEEKRVGDAEIRAVLEAAA